MIVSPDAGHVSPGASERQVNGRYPLTRAGKTHAQTSSHDPCDIINFRSLLHDNLGTV